MAYSKVNISNMSLALVGAAPIRDFTENNKRARMCDVLFEPTANLLLNKFDWPFARKFAELNQLDMSAEDIPYGSYGYQVPNDCRVPRDIYPPGSRDYWEVLGEVIFCEQTVVGLYYTAQVDSPAKYSDTFADLLSLALAVKICPAITQDKKLTAELKEQYRVTVVDAWETDANIGNSYREYNEDPLNDTFVNPDISAVSPLPRFDIRT